MTQQTETRVVNLRHEKADVRIDRRSKWGNPFKIGKDGNRATVVEKYLAWIQSRPDLIAALPELEGKILGCWCAPERCHGDVLLNLILDLEIEGEWRKLEKAEAAAHE